MPISPIAPRWHLSAYLLLAVLLCSCASRRPVRPDVRPGQAPAQHSNSEIERDVYRQVNSYRRSRDLAPLSQDRALHAAARDHSRSMATRKRLSHAGFEGRFRRLRPAGFRGLAENVAMSYGMDDPAAVATEGWRHSSGHHKNMVSRKHRYTGIGVARGRDGSVYITQLFGSR